MKNFLICLLQMVIFVAVGVTASVILPDLLLDGITPQEWFVIGILGVFASSACVVLTMLDSKAKY